MKEIKRTASVLLVLSMLLIAIPIHGGASGGFTVSGAVNKGGTDVEVSGITVFIQSNSSDMPFDITVTNEGGNYLFENVPPGNYVVYIESKPGYYERSETTAFPVSTDMSGINLLLQPDATKPEVQSVWAEVNGSDTYCEDKTIVVNGGTTISEFTLYASESVTVDGTKEVTYSGGNGAVTDCTKYGVLEILESSSDNKVLSLTPDSGKETFAQAGAYEITVPQGALLDRLGNESDEVVITVDVGDITPPVIESKTMTVNGEERQPDENGEFIVTAKSDQVSKIELTADFQLAIEAGYKEIMGFNEYGTGEEYGRLEHNQEDSEHKTLTITPNEGKEMFSEPGKYEIVIPENSFQDLSGNYNELVRIVINILEDTTPPTVQSKAATVNGEERAPNANGAFEFTIDYDKVTEIKIVYDEKVTVDDTKDVTFGGGNGVVADGTRYGELTVDKNDESQKTVLLTPDTENQTLKQTGQYEINIPVGAVKDLSGNENGEATLKFDVNNIELPVIDPADYSDDDGDKNDNYIYSNWTGGSVKIKAGKWTQTDTIIQLTIPKDSLQKSLYGGSTYDYYGEFIVGMDSINLDVTFDSDAVRNMCTMEESGDVVFEVEKADTGSLSNDVKEKIGDRPVYQFSLKVGDTQIADLNGKAQIAINYRIKEGENPNAIVVYYIDSAGQLHGVSGEYNEYTREVVFSTDHFSMYAVGYNKVTFDDVSDTDWYCDAVTFCAAREITKGTGDGMFSPDASLTRGQFIVMLMRAYDIDPDEAINDNFDDAGDTYYTGYLSAAKRMEITNGIGNNLFAPESAITRQEMFTLAYRALVALEEWPEADGAGTVSSFSDACLIADFAQEAMEMLYKAGIISGSGEKIDPLGNTTRAQMALMLYNLLSL